TLNAQAIRQIAHAPNADVLGHSSRGGVERTLQGAPKSDGAEILIIVIVLLPLLAVIAPGELTIVEHRVGRVANAALSAVHERSEINERLQNRTRLAERLKYPVELRLLIISAAGHRLDLAGLRSQHDDRAFKTIVGAFFLEGRVARFELFQSLGKRAIGDALQLQIETGKDPQTLLSQYVIGIVLLELTAQIIDVKRRIVGDFCQG